MHMKNTPTQNILRLKSNEKCVIDFCVCVREIFMYILQSIQFKYTQLLQGSHSYHDGAPNPPNVYFVSLQQMHSKSFPILSYLF